MRIVLLLAVLFAACAPADQPLNEAGPQAGSVALKTEALANQCSGLEGGQKAWIKNNLGSGWTITGASNEPYWAARGPGGQTANINRTYWMPYSKVWRSVQKSQGSTYTVECICANPQPAQTITCKKL